MGKHLRQWQHLRPSDNSPRLGSGQYKVQLHLG